MEHRNGTRISGRLNVSVWAQDRHLGWFRTVNLSSGGFSLRGRVPHLGGHSLVRVEVELIAAGKVTCLTSQAFVIYQNDHATGFMWASDEPLFNLLASPLCQTAA